MNYILFDPPEIEKFYPFTLTRPLGEMRVFGGTIKELWEKHLGSKVSYLTRDYLSDLYPTKWGENNIFINSQYIPYLRPVPASERVVYAADFYRELRFPHVRSAHSLDLREVCDAFVKELSSFPEPYGGDLDYENAEYANHLVCVNNSTALFSYNHQPYLDPFPSKRNYVNTESWEVNGEHINHVLSSVDCSKNPFLNDDEGPIIIEEDVTIMEGAMIRGPVHICKGSTIKMGAKIYGPTVIGPYCKIGGEVSNCIFIGYSNKAHEGFLGDSIIGEWCNIGAGTSNSNLKNDYGSVKIWDYKDKKFNDSGHQFIGLYMGDHSKCAINTSFNTGTIVGVNCNIFGSGFPRNFIPSFSWGGAQGIKPYDFEKALSVAEKVMSRRQVKLTDEYIKMLHAVHDITSKMK